MTVYVLLQEDQNEYGYVDTSIMGLHREENEAIRQLDEEREKARVEGRRVCDENDDGEWEIDWHIEQHSLK